MIFVSPWPTLKVLTAHKLDMIASARIFAGDYDLNVTPGFLDDIVSTIFPSFTIDGTYRAYLEQISMHKEWKELIAHGN